MMHTPSCRILAALIVFLMLRGVLTAQDEKVRFYILVDTSQSMADPAKRPDGRILTRDGLQLRRIDIAADYMSEQARAALQRGFDVRLVTFDSFIQFREIRSTTDVERLRRKLTTERVSGTTNLWGAFLRVASDIEKRIDRYQYFAVAAFTDGSHNPRKDQKRDTRKAVDREFRRLNQSLSERQAIGLKVFESGGLQDLLLSKKKVPPHVLDPTVGRKKTVEPPPVKRGPPPPPPPLELQFSWKMDSELTFLESEQGNVENRVVILRTSAANVRTPPKIDVRAFGSLAPHLTLSPTRITVRNGVQDHQVKIALKEPRVVEGLQEKDFELRAKLATGGAAGIPSEVVGRSRVNFSTKAAIRIEGSSKLDELKVGESRNWELSIVANRAAIGRRVELRLPSDGKATLEPGRPWKRHETDGGTYWHVLASENLPFEIAYGLESETGYRGTIELGLTGFESRKFLEIELVRIKGQVHVQAGEFPPTVELPAGVVHELPALFTIANEEHAEGESVVVDVKGLVEGLRVALSYDGRVVRPGDEIKVGADSTALDARISWDNTVLDPAEVAKQSALVEIAISIVDQNRVDVSGNLQAKIPEITSRPVVTMAPVTIESLVNHDAAPDETGFVGFKIEWNEAASKTPNAKGRLVLAEPTASEGLEFEGDSGVFDLADSSDANVHIAELKIATGKAGWASRASVSLEIDLGKGWIKPENASTHVVDWGVPEGKVAIESTAAATELFPGVWNPVATIRLSPSNKSAWDAESVLEVESPEGFEVRYLDESGEESRREARLLQAVNAITTRRIEIRPPVDADLVGDAAVSVKVALPERVNPAEGNEATHLFELPIRIPVVNLRTENVDLTNESRVSAKFLKAESQARTTDGLLKLELLSDNEEVLEKLREVEVVLAVRNDDNDWKRWVEDVRWTASGSNKARLSDLENDAGVEVVISEDAPRYVRARPIALRVGIDQPESGVRLRFEPRDFVFDTSVPPIIGWPLLLSILTGIAAFLGAGIFLLNRSRRGLNGKILVSPKDARQEKPLDVPGGKFIIQMHEERGAAPTLATATGWVARGVKVFPDRDGAKFKCIGDCELSVDGGPGQKSGKIRVGQAFEFDGVKARLAPPGDKLRPLQVVEEQNEEDDTDGWLNPDRSADTDGEQISTAEAEGGAPDDEESKSKSKPETDPDDELLQGGWAENEA